MADFDITSQGPPTFRLRGELDMATAPLMDVAIANAIAQGGPVTLDLSHLTFVDSSGVGAILKALGGLPSGCIILHGVRGSVQKVLDLMKVGEAANLHIIPCAVPV
jgi:anti-anti-sigma factor